MIPYYYAIIKTTLKTVNESVVLDVPYQLYSQYIMEGNKSVTYSGRVAGRSVIALIAVKYKDKEALKKWVGYVGDKWAEVKVKDDYNKVYTITQKDVKSTEEEEYIGIDKDEPFKFSEWCEETEEDLDA